MTIQFIPVKRTAGIFRLQKKREKTTEGFSIGYRKLLAKNQPKAPTIEELKSNSQAFAISIAHSRMVEELNSKIKNLEAKIKDLEKRVTIDGRTGIFNRDFFDIQIELSVLRSRRNKSQLSIMFVDLDKFKTINDTLGHPKGDEYIFKTAQLLKECAQRPTDIVARYGGEEYVIILEDTDSEGAHSLGKTIQAKMEELDLDNSDEALKGKQTLSIGICTVDFGSLNLQNNDTFKHDWLLSKADENLYFVKRNGRNNICASSLDLHNVKNMIERHNQEKTVKTSAK